MVSPDGAGAAAPRPDRGRSVWRHLSRQKSSIFNAFVKRTYASKHFVQAVFECGFSWFPDAHLISASEHDATEQIMSAFCAWLLQLVDAVERHKNRPETRKAQLNSGLEEEEREARDARSAAKRDVVIARALRREVADRASWDTHGVYEQRMEQTGAEHLHWWRHRHRPRRLEELTVRERTLVKRLRAGELEETLQCAQERHGGAVAVKAFRMTDQQ